MSFPVSAEEVDGWHQGHVTGKAQRESAARLQPEYQVSRIPVGRRVATAHG